METGAGTNLFVNWFLGPIAASHVTAENFNPITDGKHGGTPALLGSAAFTFSTFF